MIFNLSKCTLWFSEEKLRYHEITYKEAVDIMYEEVGKNPLTNADFYKKCEKYLREFGNQYVYKLSSVQVNMNINGFIKDMDTFR